MDNQNDAQQHETALSRLLDTAQLTDKMMMALSPIAHPQERTKFFHEVFGAPIHTTDTVDEPIPLDFPHMDDERLAFRVSFLLSEIFELIEDGLGLHVSFTVRAPNCPNDVRTFGSSNARLHNAVLNALRQGGKRNLIGIVDALGDINVVNNGFALELGVDMRDVDTEILASNLTKLGPDGNPIVADGSDPQYPAGKILKGPDYMPPQIAVLLGHKPT